MRKMIKIKTLSKLFQALHDKQQVFKADGDKLFNSLEAFHTYTTLKAVEITRRWEAGDDFFTAMTLTQVLTALAEGKRLRTDNGTWDDGAVIATVVEVYKEGTAFSLAED